MQRFLLARVPLITRVRGILLRSFSVTGGVTLFVILYRLLDLAFGRRAALLASWCLTIAIAAAVLLTLRRRGPVASRPPSAGPRVPHVEARTWPEEIANSN